MSSQNIGTCKLCNVESQLKESHFIPKFVGKWLKESGITGYLRNLNTINRRSQDIRKDYWLCETCEQLFSGWEREFANRIFYPFVEEGESTALYQGWLSRFCTSLSWRTLSNLRSSFHKEEEWITPEINKVFDDAQEHWAQYLLGKEKNLNQYEQHLFHIGEIEPTSLPLPPNINRYFLRTVSMDLIRNSQDIYVYTKLPSFICFGVIRDRNTTPMRNSRISPNQGTIKPFQLSFPIGFFDYLNEKAMAVTEAYKKIPSHQLNKISDFIKNNPDKVSKSKTFEAIMADYNRSGDEIF